jgi:CO dehydrogenase/acetyl-CoA synthase alpha subunit
MKFGQQIKWLDNNKKWHVGTVVANGGQGIWGVNHILNPDQSTTPECFVAQQKGAWRVYNKEGVTQAQFAYGNQHLANTGKYVPEAVASTGTMGLGAVVYQEQYKKQRMVMGR